MEAVDISRKISSETMKIINMQSIYIYLFIYLLDESNPFPFNPFLICSKSTLNTLPNCSVTGNEPSFRRKKEKDIF